MNEVAPPPSAEVNGNKIFDLLGGNVVPVNSQILEGRKVISYREGIWVTF